MNQAERLLRIVEVLGSRGTTLRASDLARRFGVSLRTVRRDLSLLREQGFALEAEAGVGLRMSRGRSSSPLHLRGEELRSLLWGLRWVRGTCDPQMARAAQRTEERILSALPAASRPPLPTFLVPDPSFAREASLERLGRVREALDRHLKLAIHYLDAQGRESRRTIRPMGLVYWGHAWTLLAWCETREALRDFRLDRIREASPTGQTFEPDPAHGLEAHLASMGAKGDPV